VRQGPLWIVEPPLSTGEQISVNDPTQPVDFSESRRSSVLKLTFDANKRPTAKWLAYPFRGMV
jgi:hypothetical protein